MMNDTKPFAVADKNEMLFTRDELHSMRSLDIFHTALCDIANNLHQGGEEYQLIAQQALEAQGELD